MLSLKLPYFVESILDKIEYFDDAACSVLTSVVASAGIHRYELGQTEIRALSHISSTIVHNSQI